MQRQMLSKYKWNPHYVHLEVALNGTCMLCMTKLNLWLKQNFFFRLEKSN